MVKSVQPHFISHQSAPNPVNDMMKTKSKNIRWQWDHKLHVCQTDLHSVIYFLIFPCRFVKHLWTAILIRCIRMWTRFRSGFLTGKTPEPSHSCSETIHCLFCCIFMVSWLNQTHLYISSLFLFMVCPYLYHFIPPSIITSLSHWKASPTSSQPPPRPLLSLILPPACITVGWC